MALVVLGWRKRSNLESRQMLGILCSSAISQLKDHFRSSRRIDPKAVKTTTPPVHMRRPGLLPGSGFCFERRWEVWYRGWTRLHIRKNDRLSSSLEKLNAFDLKQMKSHSGPEQCEHATIRLPYQPRICLGLSMCLLEHRC